ncbi:hypothetical protein [uncultured Clostridium sp.]|uniref:hypothetical protein n=1 Tax=uncultured Clostridium sp. TaxID=59620 RepID=UPI0026F2FA61|nr:hypothetical protein [uncultured Clostridium sp.]
MDSKVVFITHPYYGINNPDNNLRIYKKNRKTDKWYFIQCKDKKEYSRELKKYVLGFYDYSRDEKKSHSSMIGYFMGEKKSDDIMIQNKMRREEMAMLKDGTFIKDDMVEDMKNNWSNYLENSNTQLAVLSLYQDYVDENINVKDLQKEIATSILPKLFKYCGYENPKENLEWIVSLHTDRENNYHFHIAWVEKNKSYRYYNNKLGFKRKLKLSDSENNFMKRQVSLAIERNKLYRPALIKINEELEHLQKYFNPKDQNFTLKNISDLDLEEEIVRLGFLLSEVRDTNKKYIKYNSLPRNEIGKEIRELTRDVKRKLFSSMSDLDLSKKEVNKSIEELNNIFLDIDKRNNISNIGFESAFDNQMIKDKLEKADNYILNSIVNHALYNYDYNKGKTNKKTDKITLNDVISETAIIIYKKNGKYYPKNRKKYRLKLLEDYFIYGTYRNHDALSNALRRLSKNSNQAAEQFYEMLSENEYENNR